METTKDISQEIQRIKDGNEFYKKLEKSQAADDVYDAIVNAIKDIIKKNKK